MYGNVYLDKQDYERAQEEFSIAADHDPKNSIILIGWGRSLYATGRADEATKILKQAISLSPDYADAHFHLAKALLELDERDTAVNHFKEALNINPRYNAANHILSSLLQNREDTVDAPENRSQEDVEEARKANAFFHMGSALLQKNLFKEALAELKEAIRLRPNFPDFHNKLGEIHRKRGLFNMAAEEFRLALKLNPRYIDAAVNLAETLEDHADSLNEQAEELYKTVLEFDSQNPRARERLEAIDSGIAASE